MALSSKPQSQERFTLDEYLHFERASEGKCEYLQGRIYAMAGASPEHSTITFNLSGLIFPQLEGKPCRGFSADMKVRTAPEGLYTYPDVTVLCGEPRYHDEKRDILINPTLLIEVLSPSTEAYDRGLKFQYYREIESLTHYLLVAQDQPRIEYYVYEEGQWILREARGPGAELVLPSLGITLPLARVYRDIVFPPAPPRLSGH
jgi:Uma2 family endonuclease